MNDINPNNYPGVNATVVGTAGGTAQAPKWDKEGTSDTLEVSIAVSQGYKKGDEWIEKPTLWLRYSASGEYANVLKGVGPGDKVRLDSARLDAEEFTRKDGSTGQAFNLRYGQFQILESKAGGGSGDSFTPSGGGDGW